MIANLILKQRSIHLLIVINVFRFFGLRQWNNHLESWCVFLAFQSQSVNLNLKQLYIGGPNRSTEFQSEAHRSVTLTVVLWEGDDCFTDMAEWHSGGLQKMDCITSYLGDNCIIDCWKSCWERWMMFDHFFLLNLY